MKLEQVDLATLDDEQRRWLPNPIPAGLRVTRCTDCDSMRAEVPGSGRPDPWKKHEDECFGIPEDLDQWHAYDITDWLDQVERDESLSEDQVQRARKAASTALGVD